MKFQVSELTPVSLSKGRSGLRFTLTVTSDFRGAPLTQTLKGCLAGPGKQGLWVAPPRTQKWEPVQWCSNFRAAVLGGLVKAGYLKDMEALEVLSGYEGKSVKWEET